MIQSLILNTLAPYAIGALIIAALIAAAVAVASARADRS